MSGATLADVFAAEEQGDPFPLPAILRAAIDAARQRDPARFPSDAAVARAAGITAPMLCRAVSPTRETQPAVARRILAACGCRVVLVKGDGEG